jgi:uncharacterized damage-inducible protein DinB
MGRKFENENLEGSMFRCVNLHQATFEDVNLGDAKISNANLAGVSIDNANLLGMTIFGIRIDHLIDSELDRRDPERAKLRMKDIHSPEEVRRVIHKLDEVRGNLRTTLSSVPQDQLCERPAEGKWSAIEHLRHLVFAEDLYINRWILRNNEPFSRLGLLPDFLARDEAYSSVGSEPCSDLETILAEWDRIHSRTTAFVKDATSDMLRRDTSDDDFGQGMVGGILQGMAHHDLHHIRRAETAIASAGQQAPRGRLD